MKRGREEGKQGDLVRIRKVLEEASVNIHRELAAHIGYRTSVAFKVLFTHTHTYIYTNVLTHLHIVI